MICLALTDGSAAGSSEVIPSISLEALLAHRDAAVARLATVAQAMKEYGEIGDALGLGTPRGYRYDRPFESFRSNHGRPYHLTDPGWLEYATKCVDATLWDQLLDLSGLRTFMDAKARKEWEEQIEKNETPPLTPENVAATFRSLHAQRGEFFERGVIAVFRSLSWDYKTNSPRQFGKRIVTRVIGSYGMPDQHATDSLDDLLRVFHIMDGKPEPDHRQGVNKRLWDLKKGSCGDRWSGEMADDYMKVKVYMNGNGHVTFLRPDLVDELNRILAKHFPSALPPAEG